jgi:hypothetical protein
VKAHWHILRAIARRVGVFAGLLLSMPLAVRLYGWHEPNPVASMIALAIGFPLVLWFVGGLLGGAVANLMGGTRALLVPAYRRRVLTVSVLLGLCLWALVPLYYLSGGFAIDGIPWMRWVPLWSYGLLGLGFIGGTLSPDLGTGERALTWSRESWARSLLVLVVWLTPTFIAFNPLLRDWLNFPLDATLPGITPMAILCLLLGPLSWPAVVLLTARARSDTPTVNRNWAEQVRAGTNAAWGLPALARRTHGAGQLRIEFLVFQPALLSIVIAPLIFETFFLIFQVLVGGLVTNGMDFFAVLKTNANSLPIIALMIPLTPIYAGAIDLPRLGRSLLLPGQFKRRNLPAQLFKRLLSVWIGGALVSAISLAAMALWMGTLASTVAWFSLMVVWCICVAATIDYFRAPRAEKKVALDPVRIALSMGLMLMGTLAKPFFFDVYPAWICLAVFAVAFVIPVVLYRLGHKRWDTMEYGA